MTELGNGSVPKGGVLIGTRQMSVQLSRESAEKLKVLANVNKTTPSVMLEFIAEQGVNQGFTQLLVSKVLYVLSLWITWAKFS